MDNDEIKNEEEVFISDEELIEQIRNNKDLLRQMKKLKSGELEKLVERKNVEKMRNGENGELKRPVCIRMRESTLHKLDDFTQGKDKFKDVKHPTSLSGAIETIVELFLNSITKEGGAIDKESPLFDSFFNNYNGSKGYAGRSGKNRKVNIS